MATNPGYANLLHWYSMDETSGTRYDSHGSNNLTESGTVGYTTGVQGNAAEFTDATQYFNIGSEIEYADQDPMSIFLWANQDARPETGTLLGSIWSPDYCFLEIDGGGDLVLQNNPQDNNTYNSNLSNDTTYSICVVAETDRDVSIYVDGSIVGSAQSFPSTAFHWKRIGSRSYQAFDQFDGWIDEVAFFDDELTTDEITWMDNSGSGRAYADLAAVGTKPIIYYNERESGLIEPARKIFLPPRKILKPGMI
jgi:hypothetical protein